MHRKLPPVPTRVLIPALALVTAVILAGCASSTSAGTTQWYQAKVSTVWYAALDALRDLDADVRTANRGSGVIWAVFDPGDRRNREVHLHLTVTASGGSEIGGTGSDVLVKATMPEEDPADPDLRASLASLEQQILDLILQRSRGAGGRGLPDDDHGGGR